MLSACGGGGGSISGPMGSATPTQYIAPNDNVFVAATDPNNPGTAYGPTQGSYAGARLIITAAIAPNEPTSSNQQNYAQMYKDSSGNLLRVNLFVSGAPAPMQVSSESAATIDDLCSLNGATPALGTDVNYVAVQSYVDLANPENSVYFYRLPGSGGACNTPTDVIHMVKLGMTATDAPITALMPAAVVHDPTSGAITGFVVNEGTALTMYDENFQNRTVLMTPAKPISVAYLLASKGPTATGGLFVLDGGIVYVDYVHKSVSAPLFTVPNWDPTKRFLSSANGTTVYFAVNTTNEAQLPLVLTSEMYSMPLDGSAAPAALAAESGTISQVTVAIYGTTVAWSVTPPGGQYTIRTLAAAGQPVTALVAPANSGSFSITAGYIYYTTSTVSSPAANTVISSNTQTGIIGLDGTVIEAPVANSRFIANERDDNGSDWLALVRARNLAPVTVTDTANGVAYTEDGISGATLEAVDTTTNAVTVTLGTMPTGIVMRGTGTLVGTAGYIDGLNVNSTLDPATRELIYVDTSQAGSLYVLASNL